MKRVRLPIAVFGALVAATVAAFFVVQHLKVTTPIFGGYPNPVPGLPGQRSPGGAPVINPVSGGTCNGVSHRGVNMSFYIFKSQDIDLFVVDSQGNTVDTVADGVHMPANKRVGFHWDGRESDGSVAPDGIYRFRIALVQQDRSAPIGGPITVDTVPPRPRVASVAPQLIPAATDPRIVIKGAGGAGTVLLYRTDLSAKPELVKTFRVGKNAVWDGTIKGLPAPAGTYLVGFKTLDKACNVGSFPIGGVPLTQDPPPGTTPHAGITVRYLAAQPPLAPVPAGSRALVYVDSRQKPYRWTLFRYGVRKPVSHGADASPTLRIRLQTEGMYRLDLTSGGHATSVPLIASIGPGAPHARILVALPALTWQGQNPVDDDGDGLPDTLAANVPIRLDRPYANGLPEGVGNEAALLSFLTKNHLRYDLTTDLALAEGANPSLSGRAAVVFAGTERWLPSSLGAQLRTFVRGGGRVLSIGVDSLRRYSTVDQTPQGPRARRPTPAGAADLFGAHLGAVVTQRHPLLTLANQSDPLRLFSQTSGAFTGFKAYQPITQLDAPAKMLSKAGVSQQTPSIAAFRYGTGLVVEIGLIGFEQSLRHNVDTQAFVNRLWTVLAR